MLSFWLFREYFQYRDSNSCQYTVCKAYGEIIWDKCNKILQKGTEILQNLAEWIQTTCLGPWIYRNPRCLHARVLPLLSSPQKGDSRPFNHKFLGWLSLLVCGICFLIVFTFLRVGGEFWFVCDETSKLSPKLIPCSQIFFIPSHKRTVETHRVTQFYATFMGLK